MFPSGCPFVGGDCMVHSRNNVAPGRTQRGCRLSSAWRGEPRLTALPVCLQLVVHVGVSGMATAVTLEKCGHNKGYKGLDNCRFCPGSQCCVEDGPESIDSIIDMDAVCKRVTTLGLDVSVTISQDAGRYLCDFTYYMSLYQSHGRSAFVHVPPLGKPYNADQLGRALRAIIEEMLDVLEQSEGDTAAMAGKPLTSSALSSGRAGPLARPRRSGGCCPRWFKRKSRRKQFGTGLCAPQARARKLHRDFGGTELAFCQP
uniref:Pyroglutamyl-peptidase I n=1 Tax=Suricata suricatta TaxID=37032 RepID=A0A673TEM0_SURSU